MKTIFQKVLFLINLLERSDQLTLFLNKERGVGCFQIKLKPKNEEEEPWFIPDICHQCHQQSVEKKSIMWRKIQISGMLSSVHIHYLHEYQKQYVPIIQKRLSSSASSEANIRAASTAFL